MKLLKDKLAVQFERQRAEIKQLRREYGDAPLSDITVAQLYGGLRGVTSVVCDTSEVDPQRGLIIRGRPVGELAGISAEACFWLLLTGELPDKNELDWLSAELAARAERRRTELQSFAVQDQTDMHPVVRCCLALQWLQESSKFKANDTGARSELWRWALEDALEIIAMLPDVVAQMYGGGQNAGEWAQRLGLAITERWAGGMGAIARGTAASVLPSLEDFRRYQRDLPHWHMGDSTYWVTWRLHPSHASLPAEARDITQAALLFRNGSDYKLTAYVVMDDHVHAIVKPLAEIKLETIVQAWKSVSGHRINKAVGWSGPVWLPEYFDRIIRTEGELYEKCQYTLNNPLKRWPAESLYKWVWCTYTDNAMPSSATGDGARATLQTSVLPAKPPVPSTFTPDPELMRLYVLVHCDHEGSNACALACRTAGSALADPYLALTAGWRALAGPIHGLASQTCIEFIDALRAELGDDPTDAQLADYVQRRIESGRVIPGFGHAVLRASDPRYELLRDFALTHFPDEPAIRITEGLRRVVPPLLLDTGKVSSPYPNVDGITGAVMQHYGLTDYRWLTVLFAACMSLGLLAQLVVSRGLGEPILHPKGITPELLRARLPQD